MLGASIRDLCFEAWMISDGIHTVGSNEHH